MKTAPGATAVQIVYSSHRGSRDSDHIVSAHDDAELELLKAAARQRLAAGQGELDLGLDTAAVGGPLPITAWRMSCLVDALSHAYGVLGSDRAADSTGRIEFVLSLPEPFTGPDTTSASCTVASASARVLRAAAFPLLSSVKCRITSQRARAEFPCFIDPRAALVVPGLDLISERRDLEAKVRARRGEGSRWTATRWLSSRSRSMTPVLR